jgi:hypothetical protein
LISTNALIRYESHRVVQHEQERPAVQVIEQQVVQEEPRVENVRVEVSSSQQQVKSSTSSAESDNEKLRKSWRPNGTVGYFNYQERGHVWSDAFLKNFGPGPV